MLLTLPKNRFGELRRTPLWRTSENPQKAKFTSSIVHSPGPMQQGFLHSGRHLLWPQRRVRRGGLRSAGRPASGLALNAVVSLGSFAPLVLCGRVVGGRRFGESKERADMITARANG